MDVIPTLVTPSVRTMVLVAWASIGEREQVEIVLDHLPVMALIYEYRRSVSTVDMIVLVDGEPTLFSHAKNDRFGSNARFETVMAPWSPELDEALLSPKQAIMVDALQKSLQPMVESNI